MSISSEIIGSEVSDKVGWNCDTMLLLFSEFVAKNGLEDILLEYLETIANEEMKEFNYQD